MTVLSAVQEKCVSLGKELWWQLWVWRLKGLVRV
jgi:hypothetical protein